MNIYDIAQEAGVSIATVSRVINNKPNISAKTIRRVQEVLNKYNYVPSGIAQSLATNSSRLIGVILEDIRNRQYTNTAYAIEQELHEKAYKSLFCNVAPENILDYAKMLSTAQVEGLVIIGSVFMNKDTAQAIQTYLSDIPIIFANGTLPCPNVTSILCDDRDGIAQCVYHLVDRGHSKILYINDNNTDSASRKLKGYRTAMFECALQDNITVLQTESSFEGGIAIGKTLLADFLYGRDYTALIFPEDITALGCIRVLASNQLSIPGDVAVTGYGNTIFRIVASYNLTTVDTHLGMLGSEAVRCICARLSNAPCPAHMTLTPELLIGETS